MSGRSPGQPQSAARGAVMVIGLRWTDRLIGVLSTLILARLLVPEDFGIVAMASLVVVLIDTMLDLGVNAALVQNRDADREDFDTAWTMRILQNSIAAVAIASVGAPLAGEYFQDPRVVDVLRVMCVSLFLSGVENIGLVNFQKNMEFDREFRFFFLRRIIGFLATVALALWLRSYWAMVLGTLAGRSAGVVLSYWMHEFRPRLSLSRFARLWSFSQWMLVRNIGGFGAQQVDRIVVGRRSGASSLGAYTLADEIAAMPTGELLAPLSRVLFPAFVRVANDAAELKRVFKLALGVQTIIALPAGVGLALVAQQAVPLLLGSQWLTAVPLVQLLALVNVTMVFTNCSGVLLLTLGQVRLLALNSWLQLLLLVVMAVAVMPNAGAEEIATIRFGVSLVAVAVISAMVLRLVGALRLADLAASIWRPIVSTMAMAALLLWSPPSAIIPAVFPGLVADILVGAAAYALVLTVLWRSCGCAEGAETYLLDKLGIKDKVVARLLGR